MIFKPGAPEQFSCWLTPSDKDSDEPSHAPQHARPTQPLRPRGALPLRRLREALHHRRLRLEPLEPRRATLGLARRPRRHLFGAYSRRAPALAAHRATRRSARRRAPPGLRRLRALLRLRPPRLAARMRLLRTPHRKPTRRRHGPTQHPPPPPRRPRLLRPP